MGGPIPINTLLKSMTNFFLEGSFNETTNYFLPLTQGLESFCISQATSVSIASPRPTHVTCMSMRYSII